MILRRAPVVVEAGVSACVAEPVMGWLPSASVADATAVLRHALASPEAGKLALVSSFGKRRVGVKSVTLKEPGAPLVEELFVDLSCNKGYYVKSYRNTVSC